MPINKGKYNISRFTILHVHYLYFGLLMCKQLFFTKKYRPNVGKVPLTTRGIVPNFGNLCLTPQRRFPNVGKAILSPRNYIPNVGKVLLTYQRKFPNIGTLFLTKITNSFSSVF